MAETDKENPAQMADNQGDKPEQASGWGQNTSDEGADTPGVEGVPEDAEAQMGRVIDAFQEEIASLKDQLLRAVAETENVRSRARREREDSVKYAGVPLIKDLLSVADNLTRAMEAVPAEALESDQNLKNLLTGVEMTARELQSVFERHNIATIDPMGEGFDPHSHEALFEVPDPNQEGGKVVQVVQVGYRLHDRLLRPARVGISKAVAKPAADGTQSASPEAPGSRVDTQA